MDRVGVVCPRCGTENRAAASFCLSCVAPLMQGVEPTELLAREAAQAPVEEFPRTVVLGLGDQALTVGSLIEGFRIERTLGEGGFGVVYLGRDEALERNVAIKEYMPMSLAVRDVDTQRIGVRSERDRTTFEAGLRSFVNEARLLARFDHPSLVKVLRYWEANGTAYMAMPFYEGPTLRVSLASQRTRSTEEQLLAWLEPLLDALVTLHRENCFHRDIAPDNILLTASGPVLLDFGAARRAITDRTQVFTTMLKPGFAPIEQYGSEMLQGPWTDLYALAGVVHYAITGRPPVASVQRVVRDTQPLLSKTCAGRYSERFLAAMDAALSVRPEARPQDVAAFRALLAQDAVASPAVVPPPAAPEALATPPVPAESTMPVAPVANSLQQSPEPPAPAPAPQRGSAVDARAPAAPAPVQAPALQRRAVPLAVAAVVVAASAAAAVFLWPSARTNTPAMSPSQAARAPAAAPAAPASAPLPASASASASASAPALAAVPASALTTAPVAKPEPLPSPAPAPMADVPAPVAAPSTAPSIAPSAAAAAPAAAPKPRLAKVPRPSAAPTAQLSEKDTKEANSYKEASKSPRCGDLVLKSSFEPLNPQEIAFLKSQCR